MLKRRVVLPAELQDIVLVQVVLRVFVALFHFILFVSTLSKPEFDACQAKGYYLERLFERRQSLSGQVVLAEQVVRNREPGPVSSHFRTRLQHIVFRLAKVVI